MSQAPVRRKSRQATAAAAANAASRKPAPHLVVLRVKRKRGDNPVESLVVATDEGGNSEEEGMPDRKRHAAGGTTCIEETLADLSLARTAEQNDHYYPLQEQRSLQQTHAETLIQEPPRRLLYKRVRTIEPATSSDSKKEKRPTPAVVCPPSKSAATNAAAAAWNAENGGGGRLDALLKSRMAVIPGLPSQTPRPTAVFDFMEVRRVTARAVGSNAGNCCTNAAGASSGLGGGGDQRSNPPAAAEATEAMSSPDTAAADFHVVDIQAVRRGTHNCDMDVSEMSACRAGRGRGPTASAAGAGAAGAAKRPAAPILSPGERQMDEAIFQAFQTGDMWSIRALLASSSSPSLASINYRRRLGDGTTALMAAAFHGDLDTVRHLLSLGAAASLVDASGKSAALFAGMRGHRECFAQLQRAADVEEEAKRARPARFGGSVATGAKGGNYGGESDDFVYDLYYFEPSASTSPGDQASAVLKAGGESGGEAPGAAAVSPPLVRLSGIGPVDLDAVGHTAHVELEFEHDSDWSNLGDGDDGEDPDSNSEGYYGNDYPEDEVNRDDGTVRYVYGGGSGSSYASGHESSSDGGGGFDTDGGNEPYSRRIVDMMPGDDSDVSWDGLGASGSNAYM